MQYSLRPYSIELERLLETLEKVTGFGDSLEASLFDTIAEKLFEIRCEGGELAPDVVLELWNELYRHLSACMRMRPIILPACKPPARKR